MNSRVAELFWMEVKPKNVGKEEASQCNEVIDKKKKVKENETNSKIMKT